MQHLMAGRCRKRQLTRLYVKAYLAERARVIAEGSSPSNNTPDAQAKVHDVVVRDLSRPWV